MRRAAVGLTLVLALAGLAAAQPRPELDGPTQGYMNRQADARLRIADRELNDVYRRVMAAASASGRTRLQSAQRLWVQFRDANCEAMAGSRGGSFHPAAVSLCLEHVTDARTKELDQELHCPEGDLGCGGTGGP